MSQGLFTKLYSSVNRLFTQQDVLFIRVSAIIEKILFITHDITVDNDYRMMTFMVKDTKVICIKSPNNEIVYDTVLVGDELIILIIVPDRIMFRDYNPDNRMKIVYSIYEYICSYLSRMFAAKSNSSLQRILNISPVILTFNTLNAIMYLYDSSEEAFSYYLFESKASHLKLNDILSHPIDDLLDYGGILSM